MSMLEAADEGNSNSCLEISGNSDRTVRRAAEKMWNFFEQETDKYSVGVRRAIFKRFASRRCMRVFTEGLLIDDSQESVQRDILDNVKDNLQVVKGACSNDHLAAKRATLKMVVRANKRHSDLKVSKILGIHPRNLRKSRMQRRTSSLWALGGRQKYANALKEEVKAVVRLFWRDNTRISPNRKDVCCERIGRKQYNFHPKHFLQVSQAELYNSFKNKFPMVTISQRTFEYLKPFYVRPLKDRNVCCCQQHMTIEHLREAFNKLRSKNSQLHLDCTCSCLVCRPEEETSECQAHTSVFPTVSDLWRATVCPVEEEMEWHERNCIYGECQDCGVMNIEFCPLELESVVTWKRYELVQHTKSGDQREKVLKHVELKQVCTSTMEFQTFFYKRLEKFLVHNFVAKWQDQMFRECLEFFEEDTVISVLDFAENYSFRLQNEVQSMHWYNKQVSIFVHICYRRVGDAVVKTFHYYISDDKQHDTLFVQHCLTCFEGWVNEEGILNNRHWVWSDGCAAQFKGARPFFFVARYYSLFKKFMSWFFFGSGHGKGEHDGAAAVVKQILAREQLKPDCQKMDCAADVVQFLKSHHGITKTGNKQVFWLIGEKEVNRKARYDCRTVDGTRAIHSVHGLSESSITKIWTRTLSCFCQACREEDWASCERLEHAGAIMPVMLMPLVLSKEAAGEFLEEPDAVYGGQWTELANTLQPGDNYAVVCAEEDGEEDFWLARCLVAAHNLETEITDGWNESFDKGSLVIIGLYYDKVTSRGKSKGGHGPTYWFREESASWPRCYHFAHLIRAVGFEMDVVKGKGKQPRFRLPIGIHDRIMHALAESEAAV